MEARPDYKQCRMRHMKCDESRPACLMCKHFGTDCGGYEKNIFFACEEDDSIERFRRPLFTEEERQNMSLLLIASIPERLSLLKILSQIDDECERSESEAAQELCIHRGPFGAFKIGNDVQFETVHSRDVVASSQNIVEVAEDCFSPSIFPLSPASLEMFDTLIQDGASDLEIPLPEQLRNNGEVVYLEDRLDEFTSPLLSPADIVPATSSRSNSLQIVFPDDFSQFMSPVSTGASDSLPKSAVALLKHYSTTIIGLLTPSRATKTLWHILFLPYVKSSLAALSMGEVLDHASLSAFYGTLAISASHLKATSQSSDWCEEAATCKQNAREHIRLALRTAYDVPKVAKYKSILMSLLTMAQLMMFDGDWKQTECYLLEAEKFIRLRGLHGRKSRKRRLLHHCYAFMRLMHESLFMTNACSLQRMHVRTAVENSGLIVTGSDSPYFRLSSWKNLVQKMLQVKGRDEGENDLHLQYPGFFSATMYPEIYGLPEEWLSMLSQIIRLSNEKAAPREGAHYLSPKEFMMRAKDLEQCIINWRKPFDGLYRIGHRSNSVDENVLHPLLDALQHALVIYFYRRIYDVDSSMLQQRVGDVQHCLQRCDEASSGHIRCTSIFLWPAFVAACEAEDPGSQLSFINWFEDCISKSGQSISQHMLYIIKQVWRERLRPDRSSVTWLDFMATTNVIQ